MTDEALKRMAEQLSIVTVDTVELGKVKAFITAVQYAMDAEGLPDETVRRVVNRLLLGHPDDDTTARMEWAEVRVWAG